MIDRMLEQPQEQERQENDARTGHYKQPRGSAGLCRSDHNRQRPDAPGCPGSLPGLGIEHPDYVTEHILRFADVVPREGVIASTDCGFGTFATYGRVDQDIS